MKINLNYQQFLFIVPNSFLTIGAVIFLLILSGCATRDERLQIPVEIRDYRLGSAPGSSPIISGSPDDSSIQAPVITTTTSPMQGTISSNTPTKNWPRVSRMEPTETNRTLIVNELGDAATGGADTTVAAVATVDDSSLPEITSTGPALSTGSVKFAWPTDGKVIRPFDEDKLKGIEIAGKIGDPVYAAADGQVIYTGTGLRGYGKLVVIKHSDDYLSVYGHNSKILVKERAKVSKGSKIAEVGNTDAERPKLFFQIRKDKTSLDPLRVLPKR